MYVMMHITLNLLFECLNHKQVNIFRKLYVINYMCTYSTCLGKVEVEVPVHSVCVHRVVQDPGAGQLLVHVVGEPAGEEMSPPLKIT